MLKQDYYLGVKLQKSGLYKVSNENVAYFIKKKKKVAFYEEIGNNFTCFIKLKRSEIIIFNDFDSYEKAIEILKNIK